MDADKAKLAKFLNIVQTDANSSDEIKQKAGELITELAAPIYTTDLWIYRMVVIVLGITVLATIIGGLLLAFKGDPNYKLPSEIVAIGSAAVGALAGLLAPAPQSKG